MSFGSLSGPAVEAINRGAQIAGWLQSTGEGGISSHHLQGGDLIWQIGTGYFGCREPDGRFSMARLKDIVARAPQIRADRDQAQSGRQAGRRRRAAARRRSARRSPRSAASRRDRDCISPAAHSAFRDADEMLDFIESIADETGLPVGIKSAVGDSTFWDDLARADGQRRARRRLHHHRRRRRRHRRRAARVHRSRRAAVQGRLQPRAEDLRRARPASAGRLHRLGQARDSPKRRCSRSRSAAT